MKIVFLDRKTIGEDIDLTKFHALVISWNMIFYKSGNSGSV